MVSRSITFEYDGSIESEREQVEALLEWYCDQLPSGSDVLELFYSSPLTADEQRAKRKADGKGCDSQTCKAQGLSCVEYPPAGMTSGTSTSGESQTKCIPPHQNCYQGFVLSHTVVDLAIGDEFLFSVSCSSFSSKKVKRDAVNTTQTTNSTLLYPPSLTFVKGTSYFIIPLGDLGPGTYDVLAQVNSGSTLGGYVADNLGNNITKNDSGMSQNQSQHYQFSIDDQGELLGVGLMLATNDNKTNITWTLNAQTSALGSSSTLHPSPSATAGSGAQGQGIAAAASLGQFRSMSLTVGLVLLSSLAAGLSVLL